MACNRKPDRPREHWNAHSAKAVTLSIMADTYDPPRIESTVAIDVPLVQTASAGISAAFRPL